MANAESTTVLELWATERHPFRVRVRFRFRFRLRLRVRLRLRLERTLFQVKTTNRAEKGCACAKA